MHEAESGAAKIRKNRGLGGKVQRQHKGCFVIGSEVWQALVEDLRHTREKRGVRESETELTGARGSCTQGTQQSRSRSVR